MKAYLGRVLLTGMSGLICLARLYTEPVLGGNITTGHNTKEIAMPFTDNLARSSLAISRVGPQQLLAFRQELHTDSVA